MVLSSGFLFQLPGPHPVIHAQAIHVKILVRVPQSAPAMFVLVAQVLAELIASRQLQ